MTDLQGHTGLLIVVSAPSGGGKGTILRCLFDEDDRLRRSVSAATRAPRDNELDGRDYHFISPKTFREWIDQGRFAEWAEVHGELKGTLRDELDRMNAEGGDAVLELDVQGMRNIRKACPHAVTVFIAPPSLEVLEKRLRNRGDLDEDALLLRIENAKAEIAAQNEYDHVIVNDRLDDAVAQFRAVLCEERKKAGLPQNGQSA